MKIFISYARTDAIAVRQLHGDISRSSHDAWFDERLEGGQDWWQEIVDQISTCGLFVFVVSTESVQSRACGAELAYAVALRRPVVPVQIRDVDLQLAPDPLPSLQVIDYRDRTPEGAIELMSAINRTPELVPLPDPLPVPPPPPFRSFGPVRSLLSQPRMSLEEQQTALQDLSDRAASVDERDTAMTLLREMRGRSDIAESVARDVDDMLIRAVGRTGSGLAPEEGRKSADLLKSLITQIQKGRCTPILGWGLTDSLVGPRQLVARSWAETFEFPMASHREDLPQVANFVAAMTDVATLRESLDGFYRKLLKERYPSPVTTDNAMSLDQVIRDAWEHHSRTLLADPYRVLAQLRCPIYVTAQPNTLLTDALQENGQDPVVELCRWRPDVHGWPESVFDREPSYTPHPDRPLVFHVFGNVQFADSLVITEDDYFEFLARVPRTPSLVPAAVREAMVDSALLLLGFRLDEWDIRVLLRSLVSQPGAKRLRNYRHVAAQIDISGQVLSPARARDYLVEYFKNARQPSIDIYWGSVEEFAFSLQRALEAET